MKKPAIALMPLILALFITACSAEQVQLPTAKETLAAQTLPSEAAEINSFKIHSNKVTGTSQKTMLSDYYPLYENAVYVYEIQSNDTDFETIEYKVKLDFVKQIDDITAAQFTRYNDTATLFSYVIIFEENSINSLQYSFADADDLTSESLADAKQHNAYYSLINEPLDLPHQWNDWYQEPQQENTIEHIHNWMSSSEIINPVVPLPTLLGTVNALEVLEYYEEQGFSRCYYVPRIGLVRMDSMMPEDTVSSSDVLIRIEGFNHTYDGNYYKTLDIYPAKNTK